MAVSGIDLGKYKLGWHDTEQYVYEPKKGVNEDVVREISHHKSEPEWMTKFRLNALKRFERKPMLEWFAKNMPDIDFDNIYYYLKPTEGQVNDWDMLPDEMKATYEKLGIPEAERKFLAGVTAQYESEVVYHKNREDLERKGILFTSMDQAVIEYPELVQRYFGTVIPPGDNKFAALNSAVWSGGSFIYVPPGVHVDMPLAGVLPHQRGERGPVRADADHRRRGRLRALRRGLLGAGLHHGLVALGGRRADRAPGAHIRYTTIQNWSPNVYNLVTKRARAETESTVEWIDGNLGSKLTMKYPAVVMVGPKAHGEVLSVAYAGPGQHQDAGAKMTHAAPETTSIIDSKSISKDGGRTTYRGLVRVEEGAHNVKAHVRCDALILDEQSRSDTYPYMEIEEKDARIGHEATVSKVGDDQLFYLQSRGLTEQQATAMIVNGFIEPIVKTLPMEYAVELSRLIELNMEGAVG